MYNLLNGDGKAKSAIERFRREDEDFAEWKRHTPRSQDLQSLIDRSQFQLRSVKQLREAFENTKV